MKKLISMIALTAIAFGSVYAHGTPTTTTVKATMQSDTTKKKKSKRDTTKKDTLKKPAYKR